MKGETSLTNRDYTKLLIIAFLGSFAGAFTGLGTGSIFNPVLISLNLHPAVGSATGMYLTLYVTLCGTIVMAIFGMLNIQYFIVLNILVTIGTIPGLYL